MEDVRSDVRGNDTGNAWARWTQIAAGSFGTWRRAEGFRRTSLRGLQAACGPEPLQRKVALRQIEPEETSGLHKGYDSAPH